MFNSLTFRVTSMTIISQHKDMTRLCVGCGICVGICPANAIKLKTDKEVATVNFDYSRCTNCALCTKLCPALFNLYRLNTKFPNTLGRIQKIFFGYSADNIIRHHAASGGVVTSLLLYMLKRKIVDEVLVTKMEGLTASAILTNDKDEIISAQGSIYFKTFSLTILPKLLSHLRKGKRISIVGLPCQISALKKVLKNFEENLYFIGLICNHTNESWYLWHILKKYLPENATPSTIGSRKDGWPGGIKIIFNLPDEDFQELTIPHNTGVWGLLPSLNISAPLGCLTCADHLASTADIVAGDAWHPKYVGKDSSGVSILIVRTDKGLDLLKSTIKDGTLYGENAKLLDLLLAQGHNIVEGSQYAPFKQKLLKYHLEAIYELKEVDKIIIALLLITNSHLLKYKVMRQMLNASQVKKLLHVLLWFLSRYESIKLRKAVRDFENEIVCQARILRA